MPKRKPLSDYLEQIKSAGEKQDWVKAKQLGETALKKLTFLDYTPFEQYLLYNRLGVAYYQLSEFSRSIDIVYKAYLITSRYHFEPAKIVFTYLGIAQNLVMLKKTREALIYLQKVIQYYQKYGREIKPMTEKLYCRSLVLQAYCYLDRNELDKAQQVLEQDIPSIPSFISEGSGLINYQHILGEYFIVRKEYGKARFAFQKCITESKAINFTPAGLQASIHLAVLDIIDRAVGSAIDTLKNIFKEAKRLKLNDLVCEAGLLLSKCYSLKGLPHKAVSVENKIKPILSKLDTIWLYEKMREFEKLYQQLIDIPQSKTQLVPEILIRTLNSRYEKSPYKQIIIGHSPAMQEVWQLLEKVAPTDLPILIQGETGTGKELIAHAIHQNSQRINKTYLPFNCGVGPETLVESELFGHTRGAFTGAIEEKKGYIELASGGTLFIDEISNMSPSMQQKLLRVLEEKLLWKVGASKPTPIDTRFIFASNQDIEQMVRNKLFREDLFYRIHTIILNLPPLRDRKDDIPLLAQHFLKKYATSSMRNSECGMGNEGFSIPQSTLHILMNYPWPGNVRELENEIKRICVLYPDAKQITEKMLSETIRCYIPIPVLSASKNSYLKHAVEGLEKDIINEAIRRYNGNITHIAQYLGCTRAVLYKKTRRLKITL